jgi:hypothetical protein
MYPRFISNDLVSDQERHHRLKNEPCSMCGKTALTRLPMIRGRYEPTCLCKRCGICSRSYETDFFIFTFRTRITYDAISSHNRRIFHYEMIPFDCPCLDIFGEPEIRLAFQSSATFTPEEEEFMYHRKLRAPNFRKQLDGLKNAPFKVVQKFLSIWANNIIYDHERHEIYESIWAKRIHDADHNIPIPKKYLTSSFSDLMKYHRIPIAHYQYVAQRQRG